jgi:hypothetical protein
MLLPRRSPAGDDDRMREPKARRTTVLGWTLLTTLIVLPLVAILVLWHRLGFIFACQWAGWTWPQ